MFRISGPGAGDALSALTGGRGRPRMARRVMVRTPAGEVIDDGLALWFPGPNSFTGEDVAELHLHGSPAVRVRLAEVLDGLGIEPAGPGAFTMRAFSNGKLDLTQAEGLGELLEAETTIQHRQAISHLRGALRETAEGWRSDLIRAMALLDAAVDFPDEEDVAEAIVREAAPIVQEIGASVRATLDRSGSARRVSAGIRVALLGPANAGKSTLFNALVEEERAIVSAEAGTTRDTVEAAVDFRGHRVTFVDTAGLRDGDVSEVEAEGMRRARRIGSEADIRLLCWPANGGAWPVWLEGGGAGLDMRVVTKADLGRDGGESDVRVSAVSGEGLEALRGRLAEALDGLAEPGLAPTARQQSCLREASSWLEGFEQHAAQGPEAGAEALRMAARALESLTGRIAPDDVLGDIFGRFCIGK